MFNLSAVAGDITVVIADVLTITVTVAPSILCYSRPYAENAHQKSTYQSAFHYLFLPGQLFLCPVTKNTLGRWTLVRKVKKSKVRILESKSSACLHKRFVFQSLTDVAHHGDGFHFREYGSAIEVFQMDGINILGSMHDNGVIRVLATQKRKVGQVVFDNVFDLEFHDRLSLTKLGVPAAMKHTSG